MQRASEVLLEHATQTQDIISRPPLLKEGRDWEEQCPDVLGQQQGVGQRNRKHPATSQRECENIAVGGTEAVKSISGKVAAHNSQTVLEDRKAFLAIQMIKNEDIFAKE